jgi:methyl acetate hydrolase
MTSNNQNRRDVLRSLTTLAAASSIAGAMRPSTAGAAVAEPGLSPALGQVDQALRQAVDAGTVPGIVAIGATDKGVVYEGAFGPSITADSVFWIASMTKAITATACMQLVEQGKLQLDQEMGKLLPQLESPKVLEGFDATGAPKLRPAKRPITLQQLLTHTAGFTYSIWSEPMTQFEKVTGTPFIGECRNATFTAPIEFDPGDRWQYGINIDWVGRTVEAISGLPLEVYFRQHIFAPLGMSDTDYAISAAQRSRLVSVHQRKEEGSIEPIVPPDPPWREFWSGGGGLYSTGRDYLVFLQMLMHGGRFNGAQLLRPQTVALMGQNQIGDIRAGLWKTTNPQLTNDLDLFPGIPCGWGLGYMINTQPGANGRSAGSLTWGGIFNTYYWLDPQKRIAGVFLTQILPFADHQAVALYGEFERGVYGTTKSA